MFFKAIAYTVFGEKTSFKAVTCCVVIIIGLLIGADQENEAGADKLFNYFTTK
jgi:hypothetical protein